MNPDMQSVRAQLEAILDSEGFTRSPRMQRFLRFIVEETLAGRAEQLGEYAIATAVFDRSADFEPAVDPIVRNDARRLRVKLAEYYSQNPAPAQGVLIEMPKGGYVPTFLPAQSSARPAEGVCRVVINLFRPGHQSPVGEWTFDVDLSQASTVPLRLALAA